MSLDYLFICSFPWIFFLMICYMLIGSSWIFNSTWFCQWDSESFILKTMFSSIVLRMKNKWKSPSGLYEQIISRNNLSEYMLKSMWYLLIFVSVLYLPVWQVVLRLILMFFVNQIRFIVKIYQYGTFDCILIWRLTPIHLFCNLLIGWYVDFLSSTHLLKELFLLL
jgi:hypothetical protein